MVAIGGKSKCDECMLVHYVISPVMSQRTFPDRHLHCLTSEGPTEFLHDGEKSRPPSTEHPYRLLNMRSATTSANDTAIVDDRTAKARIRDAAIHCFAENGISKTTVRKVAARAGVSPGLVIHHFGSMENLRAACDESVVRAIREVKENAMSAGPGLDVFGLLHDASIGSAARYLARVLSSGSPTVDGLVDDLVADAEAYFDRGVETGMLRPSDDPRGRAVVLVLWSLGGLVLHDQFDRLIGVDLTDPDVGTSPNIAAYMGPVYEILGTGIFTEALAEHLQSVVAEAGSGGSEPASTSPPL